MSKLLRNTLMSLSQNDLLNKYAQKYAYSFVAEQFVAGLDVDSVMQTVHRLNDGGISCTVDHLGEFVTDREVSLEAKRNIIALLERIAAEKVDCHISVKLTQLGLDIDEGFCLANMQDILQIANGYNIFVNIDTEDYAHYDGTMRILTALRESHMNVGTVVQAYYYHAEDMMDALANVRLRIVKGAYKEGRGIAYQTKEEIDANFLKLAKKRLLGNTFTSIATHDHHIIDELKDFVARHNIDKNKFEFQMLYGFRENLQTALVEEGYLFCTYLPFGHEWYGYFMRRLAERPRNIQLILKDKLYHDDNRLKKKPLLIATSLLTASFLIWKKVKK